MARNIKSYIQKATLVFQEEGQEDITIEVQMVSKGYEAYGVYKWDGSKPCFASTPTEAAKRAFEAVVAIIETRKGNETIL